MSYLLAQILICLLIAGLIGAVIGWLLRGGCSSKLRDCEDEWKMKMGSLESEWNSKLQRTAHDTSTNHKEIQAATLKRHAQHVETETPSYSYEQELKKQLQQSQELAKEVEKQTLTTNNLNNSTTKAVAGASAIAATLAAKGINLSDDKIKLYEKEGVDFSTIEDLEDDYGLDSLDSIDTIHSTKLKEMGIHSTKDFVTLGKDSQKVKEIANTLKVDDATVESWVGKSCLLSLPGVDKNAAKLMQDAGISSVHELANYAPEEIHQKILTHNQQALIPSSVPDVKSVSLWSKLAKPLAATTLVGSATQALGSTRVSESIQNSVDSATSYAEELKAKLQPNHVGFDLENIQHTLAQRGIKLSEDKIKLYHAHGIDFAEGSFLEDNYDVAAIEGIGPKYVEALKSMGIHSTQELVGALQKDHQKIDQIAKSLKVQPEALSSWVSMADIIQLPGVDGQAAELIQTVGISSLSELGVTNANSLHNEMVSFNKKSPIVPEVPSAEAMTRWSKLAKLLS
jgi:nucleotidyltransferase/DNA polymerase involved in DNA repair